VYAAGGASGIPTVRTMTPFVLQTPHLLAGLLAVCVYGWFRLFHLPDALALTLPVCRAWDATLAAWRVLLFGIRAPPRWFFCDSTVTACLIRHHHLPVFMLRTAVGVAAGRAGATRG